MLNKRKETARNRGWFALASIREVLIVMGVSTDVDKSFSANIRHQSEPTAQCSMFSCWRVSV